MDIDTEDSVATRYQERIRNDRLSWQWHCIFITCELLLATLIAIKFLG